MQIFGSSRFKRFTDKYLYKIESQINCPIVFYRIPKIIFYNFARALMINNFTEMINKVDNNRPIVIIILIGDHQIGKSTFLVNITGNGAYEIGNGFKSTTKGLLLEGPYTIGYLIERIPAEYHQLIQKINGNPAIFFMDSQGFGDEEAQNIENDLKKVDSIFCSISTICIYITKMNETMDNFQKSVQVIQQMANANQIFFLIRNDANNELKELLSEETTDSYIQGKNLLPNIWQYFRNVSNILYNNSFQLIPYGDIANEPITYNSILWNITIDIFNAIHNSKIHTKEELIESFEDNLKIFYTRFLESALEKLPESDIPKHIRNSPFAKQIYVISLIFLSQIDETFEAFKENPPTNDEKNLAYNYIIFVFKLRITYFVRSILGLSIYDFKQYEYDILKCLIRYLTKKEPNYKYAKYNREISRSERNSYAFTAFTASAACTALGGISSLAATSISEASILYIASEAAASSIQYGITAASIGNGITAASIGSALTTTSTSAQAAGFVSATITTTNAASGVLSVCVPILGVIAVSALVGGCIYLAYSKINENNYKKIREKKPLIPLPFLWEIKNDENRPNMKVLKVSDEGIVDYQFKESNLFVAMENIDDVNDFYPMKFIIECLTGINCNYINDNPDAKNAKEAILFGPFKSTDVVVRISKFDMNYISNIKGNIYILYLRNCLFKPKRKNQILSYMTSVFINEDNKNIDELISDIRNYKINLFCFQQKMTIFPISKGSYPTIKNETAQKIIVNNEPNIDFWPIMMENHNYKKLGPMTNKLLSISLHKIMERKKKNP